MSREQYIQQRYNSQVDVNSAYEFYFNTTHSKQKIGFQDFVKYFPQWMGSSTLEYYWKHYDAKFNVLTTKRPDGSIIFS